MNNRRLANPLFAAAALALFAASTAVSGHRAEQMHPSLTTPASARSSNPGDRCVPFSRLTSLRTAILSPGSAAVAIEIAAIARPGSPPPHHCLQGRRKRPRERHRLVARLETAGLLLELHPRPQAPPSSWPIPALNAAPRLLATLNGFAKSLQWSPDGKLLGFLYVEGATRPSGALAADEATFRCDRSGRP